MSRRSRLAVTAGILLVAFVLAGNELLLRYSYSTRLRSRSLDEDPLYCQWLLPLNKWRVRAWIRRDFARASYLDDLPYADQEMSVLFDLHQREDLELLWYRAERGFDLRPGSEDDVRSVQSRLVRCRNLAYWIGAFYGARTEEGVVKLREELLRRKLAPEVRAAFERYEERLGVSLLPREQGRKKEPTPMAHP